MILHLGLMALLVLSTANLINDNELAILASELSDEECKTLLFTLHERRQGARKTPRLEQYSGRCMPDLHRWLAGEETDSFPLTELDEALRDIGKPDLRMQISREVVSEKARNLHNFFGRDGRIPDRDILGRWQQ